MRKQGNTIRKIMFIRQLQSSSYFRKKNMRKYFHPSTPSTNFMIDCWHNITRGSTKILIRETENNLRSQYYLHTSDTLHNIIIITNGVGCKHYINSM